MTEKQKAARRQLLRTCEELMSAYLVGWLSDDIDPEVEVEGFEHVDPEVDDIRSQLVEMEMNT
jgi:hypothetical protein